MKEIDISPLTRIEGHLAVHTEVEEFKDSSGAVRHRVKEARCEGEMFRGFEAILKGRDPLDAQQITQRICGVCPISHGMASIRALEAAFGVSPNKNGRLIQNIILGTNYIQSHLTHFYQLSALDYVDVSAILKYKGKDRTLTDLKSWVERQFADNKFSPGAPLLPGFSQGLLNDADINCALLAHYAEALEMRKVAHEAAAIFAGKMPHSTALVPGGCTQTPTFERIISYNVRLKKLTAFIENVYFPDILTVAAAFPGLWDTGKGWGDLLCFGAFDIDERTKLFPSGAVIKGRFESLSPESISEQTGFSKFSSSSGLHPSKGETEPAPGKRGAYSWVKAPRYRGLPMEVGPSARIMCALLSPESRLRDEIGGALKAHKVTPEKLASPAGRILSRGIETKIIAAKLAEWIDSLDVEGPPAADFTIPKKCAGAGLVEAPRGALGHWISIDNHAIERYQCVVPTTWNCSPRDDSGTPGPVEKALEGLAVENSSQPVEIGRVVRSFDPCLACAIH